MGWKIDGESMSCFAERLKELRVERGLSQAQLAKEVGVSSVAIVYWESKQRIPNLDSVIDLAKFFNVSLDYIAGLED